MHTPKVLNSLWSALSERKRIDLPAYHRLCIESVLQQEHCAPLSDEANAKSVGDGTHVTIWQSTHTCALDLVFHQFQSAMPKHDI